MKSVLFALYVITVNPLTGDKTEQRVNNKTYESYMKCHVAKAYYNNDDFTSYVCRKIKWGCYE